MSTVSLWSILVDFNPLKWIWRHLTTQIPLPQADLTGRVCIVTGANQGLGYETALHLAQMNCSRLILAVRDVSKGHAAAERIKAASPHLSTDIEVVQLDMADLSSVGAFAQRMSAELERLDIVILNAGTAGPSIRYTKDGWEETLQVNVISTSYLAWLLLPKLSATAKLARPPGSPDLQPHLTISGSEAHFMAQVPAQNAPGSILDALNDPKYFGLPDERYNTSKLLVIYICKMLSETRNAEGVVINNAHPGLCRSEIRRDFPRLFAISVNLVSWSAEFGSRNYLFAALNQTSSGAYTGYGREERTSAFSTSLAGRQLEERVRTELMQKWKELDEKGPKLRQKQGFVQGT